MPGKPGIGAFAWVVVVAGFCQVEVLSGGATGGEPAAAPQSSGVLATPEMALLQALSANPATAAYRLSVARVGGRYVLSGRVGTKQAHDVAVRTAIALGIPVRDDLTIDTFEANRAAAAAMATAPAARSGGVPYIYPPPLFGRWDDPFFGFEPPVVSYPPWWGGVARRGAAYTAANLGQGAGMGMGMGGGMGMGMGGGMGMGIGGGVGPGAGVPEGPGAVPQAGGAAVPAGSVEMTLDPRGVAVLRGNVPTLADRVNVGQAIARTPGVVEVVNLLDVVGARAANDMPPPPPTPAVPRTPAAPAAPSRGADAAAPGPKPSPAVQVDGGPLANTVAEAIARRPALSGLSLRVSERDGVVTLSGRAPSVYEAMLAYRAAEQTPGVSAVVDRQEFPLPDGEGVNPLRDKGRPEDVGAYILAHLRRQLRDIAHVDRVEPRGDTLDVRGTVTRESDKPRAEATLRSIPLLRGWRLEPHFLVD